MISRFLTSALGRLSIVQLGGYFRLSNLESSEYAEHVEVLELHVKPIAN